ncbi:MAG TPA: ABC transporter permease [Bryobacteraceae bacterium]|jgi:predicted permease
MRRFFLRLWNLLRGGQAERELAREIEAHLTLLQEDFERRGLPPEEARLAAKREYGGIEQAKELHRAERSFVWVEQFFKDVRYGWSNLLRNPGFTFVAVTALALGIGVNATIFGIYNAVALKQLPLSDPAHVMRVKRWTGTNSYAYKYTFAYPEYNYLREHNDVFSGVTAASSAIPVMASIEGESAVHVNGYAVSANYFAELGVKARIGRTFLPEEDRLLDANPVVVLSYRFWQKKFNGDSNVLGRVIKLNGLAYTIAGVAPEGFSGTNVVPAEAAFWAPLSMIGRLDPSFGPAPDSTWHETWRDSSHPGFELMARLRNGVELATAQAEVSGLLRRYLSAYREEQPTTSVTLQHASYFGAAGDFWLNGLAVAVLMTVSLVLLVACANVANMLLARGAARQREIGIRLALGAGRARVIRQLLVESVLLALLGGAAAIPLAAWAGKLLWVSLNEFAQGNGDLTVDLDVSPDAHVFLYGLGLSLLTGILFGLAPALQSTRTDLNTAIKQEGSAAGGQMGRSRLRGLLLGTQVMISVLLLVVSGEQLRGLASSFASASDLGYETRDTFLVRGSFGNDFATALSEKQRLLDRLEWLPEVSSVAHGWPNPGSLLQWPATAGKFSGQAITSFASDGYFETLGIPILRGRGLTRQEAEQGAALAVISEATARRAWPNQDPLGKRFSITLFQNAATNYEVVGIAKDVRFALITEVDPTHIYLPDGQGNDASPDVRMRGPLLFRIHGNRDQALAAVQSAVASVDPKLLPRLDLTSLGDGPVALQRELFRVVALFPAVLTLLSLTLAGVGIYGVMAFLVSQRTKEIGIRMALGARSRVVVRSMVIQGLRPVFVGMLVGLAVSIPVEAVIRSKMPRLLDPAHSLSWLGDPIVLGELALVLFIAVLASVVPARRAMRVDPMVALRYE